MHEASFELIEIPHLRQSGKNSADIRLVVDALDLCYTKSHVDTFVIISGDSDFSPLVSKLRENAKYVIGVGVKQSTSDLLIGNCDEFIFYDDLVREMQRSARRDSKEAQPVIRRTPEEDAQRRAEIDARRNKAIELAVATFDALVGERGDSSKIWASMLKEAIKRRKPDFNESYYGFRAFGNLLEEAQARGLLEIGRDEKSGTYVFRANGMAAPRRAVADEVQAPLLAAEVESVSEGAAVDLPGEPASEAASARRKGEGRRKAGEKGVKRAREVREVREIREGATTGAAVDSVVAGEAAPPAVAGLELPPPEPVEPVLPAPLAKPCKLEPEALPAPAALPAAGAEVGESEAESPEAEAPVVKKPSRPRRPRKPKAPLETPEAS
jgi:hypothetical protein